MARVVVTPGRLEVGRHEAEYAALVDALRAAGHEAVLERPVEERGAPGVEVAAHVVVYVYEHGRDLATDAVLLEIARRVGSRVRDGRRRRVRVEREGEPSRDVDVPDVDE